MNKYLEYEQILKEQISSSIFAIIATVILLAVVIFLNVRGLFKDLKKIGKTIVNMFVVAVALASIIFFTSRIYSIKQDIELQAYVTYYGEFNVSEFRDSYVTLIDQNKTIALSGRCDLSGGDYTGTIVYSKSSKQLLDWDVETN